MNEQQHIERCIELMEQDLEWGPSSEWTTYNFDKLSSYIKEKSKISLSGRTLRRLICDPRNFKPQAATKNALAKYVGYEDWEQFKRSGKQNGNAYTEADTSDLSAEEHIFLRLLRKGWFYLIPVFILIIVLSIVLYPVIVLKLNTMRVEFTSNYTTGTAPQRVTFFYDVSRVNSSNIFINENFYDDGNIIPVNNNRHYFTSDFELPDHYSVKIMAKGERLSCIRIHVISNGWEGVINDQYVGRLDNSYSPGIMTYPTDTVAKYVTGGVDNLLEFRNIREFGILADNMTLETEIRNLPDSSFSECLESTVQLINLHGRVGFDFVNAGCPNSMLQAEFGDVLLNGEFQDLVAFYQDFSEWRKVTISIHDKRIYVYLEDREIYSVKYSDPLDEVKGIAFKFRGLGEVNYVKLYNSEGTLVYKDNF
ncbi:MAG: hypothetical protein KAS29_06995 [Bacteroidales bacterium]|nr:hypothetical protein [Bacteroidales bacterium]